jgi:hypothetical protein
LRLPEVGASVPNCVGDFKTYVLIVIVVCAFVGKNYYKNNAWNE